MAESAMQVTRILDNVNRGDPEAVGRLAAVVYDELHRLAAGQLRDERADERLPSAIRVIQGNPSS